MFILLAAFHVANPDVVWLWANNSETNRGREWGELYHSIRLFKKYSINYGRLIVAAHGEPSYAHQLGVEIVQQNSFARYLPFAKNSLVFEFQFDKLIQQMNLTQTILYLNDDVMVTQPFDADKHCRQGPCQETFGKFGFHYSGTDTFVSALTNVNRAMLKVNNNFLPQHQMAHVPICVRIPVLRFIWKKFDIPSSLTIGRSSKNFQFQYMHAMVDSHLFKRNPRQCDYHFIMANGPLSELKKTFDRIAFDSKPFVCVNDNIETRFLQSNTKMAFRAAYLNFFKKL